MLWVASWLHGFIFGLGMLHQRAHPTPMSLTLLQDLEDESAADTASGQPAADTLDADAGASSQRANDKDALSKVLQVRAMYVPICGLLMQLLSPYVRSKPSPFSAISIVEHTCRSLLYVLHSM